jgi:hypothetical protein
LMSYPRSIGYAIFLALMLFAFNNLLSRGPPTPVDNSHPPTVASEVSPPTARP